MKYICIFMPGYRIAVDKLSPKWISFGGRCGNMTVQKAQSIRMGLRILEVLCLLICYGFVQRIDRDVRFIEEMVKKFYVTIIIS